MFPELVRFQYRSEAPSVPDSKLDLKVIFTDIHKTAAALATARTMARGLGAHITLMVAQVVPYPLPLSAPDVPVEFLKRMLASITSNDVGDTSLEIYLCRDRHETIRRALPPDSLVIVGVRKLRWWPSWERHLARMLRKDGRRVVAVTA